MLALPDPQAALALAGPDAAILRRLESLTGASLVLRGLDLVAQGRPSQVERVMALIRGLEPLWSQGEPVAPVDVQTAQVALDTGRLDEHRDLTSLGLGSTATGKPLRPRTFRQRTFVEAHAAP